MKKKKAVILLSGGLDSSTILYYARKKGYSPYSLIFSYGQKHSREIITAKKIAASVNSSYKVITFSLPFLKSSLLNGRENIPSRNISTSIDAIPSTYVPGRNTIFLAFALSYAEEINASAIFIGANAVDYSGYPDCRPVYYKAFQKLIASLGKNIKIETPLLKLNKAQIVKLGMRLKVPFHLTWSCYKGGKIPCGVCDSCKFREKGFMGAGISDPAKNVKI